MPASGKKAMKRAARAAAYTSDDEEIGKLSGPKERAARVNPTAEDGDDGPTMEDLEGMSDSEAEEEGDEDDSDEDGPLEEGPLTDLRAVERRMRTSARVLANWRELGDSTGK